MEAKKILNRIFENEQFSIRKLNGRRPIAKARNTFVYIDNGFEVMGLNKTGNATPEILVEAYEIVSYETFTEVFNALPGKRRQKLLSQNQIIEICETHTDLLQCDFGTFFFIEKNWSWFIEWLRKVFVIFRIIRRQYFVVYVRMSSDGLYVSVGRLELGYVWRGEGRPRVVAPQLKPSVA